MQPLYPAGLSGVCRITDHLYLSNARAANDASQLTGNDITCVINAMEKARGSALPPGVRYIHVPVSDEPATRLCDHFDEVADEIQAVAERSGRTLLYCNAGVSRSAALCMAYLMKHGGMTLLEAHGRVKARRPMARPNGGFWGQLVRYERELRGSNSVHMVASSMGEIPDIYHAQSRNMTPL